MLPNYQGRKPLGSGVAEGSKKSKLSLVAYNFGDLMAEKTDLTSTQKIFFSLLPVILGVILNVLTTVAVVAYSRGQDSIRMNNLEQRQTSLERDISDHYATREYTAGRDVVRDEQYKEIIRRLDQLDSNLLGHRR